MAIQLKKFEAFKVAASGLTLAAACLNYRSSSSFCCCCCQLFAISIWRLIDGRFACWSMAQWTEYTATNTNKQANNEIISHYYCQARVPLGRFVSFYARLFVSNLRPYAHALSFRPFERVCVCVRFCIDKEAHQSIDYHVDLTTTTTTTTKEAHWTGSWLTFEQTIRQIELPIATNGDRLRASIAQPSELCSLQLKWLKWAQRRPR